MLPCSGTLLGVMLGGCHGSPAPQAQHKLHLEHLFGFTTFPHPDGFTKLVTPLWQGAGTGHDGIWWHEAAPWCYRCVGFDYSSAVCGFEDNSVMQGGRPQAWREFPQKELS